MHGGQILPRTVDGVPVLRSVVLVVTGDVHDGGQRNLAEHEVVRLEVPADVAGEDQEVA